MNSLRLAYQDLSIKAYQDEEKLKRIDPAKAKRLERLGTFRFQSHHFSPCIKENFVWVGKIAYVQISNRYQVLFRPKFNVKQL